MERPSDFTTVYFDSCVFIKYIIDAASYPEIGDVMQLVQSGRLNGVINAVHWVEVLGKQRPDAFDQERESRAQALLSNPQLSVVDVGPQVLQRARHYALHRGFKPMDAIHVASAVEAEADVLMSYDRKLGLGRAVDDVWLDQPYVPGDPTLFGS